jgi:hypothetical protein
MDHPPGLEEMKNLINKNFIDLKANARFIGTTALDLSGIGAPYKFTKYVIVDPFNNRKEIAKVAKNRAGVYLFQSFSGGLYVGSSFELYSRVVHYFQPGTLLNADRHVLYHFRNL